MIFLPPGFFDLYIIPDSLICILYIIVYILQIHS